MDKNYLEGSFFNHEREAIESINQNIQKYGLGYSINNFSVNDHQSNRYFEIDYIVIANYGIYIVELKHWSGTITIKANNWIQNNSFTKKDPHILNGMKAKLVKGLYERQFPSYPNPKMYFESVVILTNPQAIIEGASNPKTRDNNPSFKSIDSFIKYLKCQKENNGDILSNGQRKNFEKYLKQLHYPNQPKNFLFPGYDIIKQLYRDSDRAEIVAQRNDIKHQKLTRLRIFFPKTNASIDEQKRFHKKALASLEAVAKIDNHPNILYVWSVPNENNFIVEGSEWSETGTLHDMIKQEKKLSVEVSKKIFEGILYGLKAIHEQDVIHRNLTPKNILMVNDTPKLTNFDLSYQLEDDRATVIPDASKLKYSPYIAPEIYKGLDVEASADIYSAGVILVELLTGKPRAFESSEQSESLKNQLKENGACDNLLDIIESLIQPDPDKRIGQVYKVIDQLYLNRTIPSINPILKPDDYSDLYHIVRYIKKGAASQIYEARGPQSKKIAIKLYNEDVPLIHVLHEQQFTASINHPSIVRVGNYGKWRDERLFISFDWIEGKTLRQEIDEGNTISLQRFFSIAFQLIDVLISLHSNIDEDDQEMPILHNDIKPDNIILSDQSDKAILIDFGSASHPFVGGYKGTKGYVAPDLHKGLDRNYCIDGDLYALGVTLNEWKKNIDTQSLSPDDQDMFNRLIGWLNQSTDDKGKNRFHSAKKMHEKLNDVVHYRKEKKVIHKKTDQIPLDKANNTIIQSTVDASNDMTIQSTIDSTSQNEFSNHFVTYLNSLHCRSAACDNALAESQVCNQFFGLIHIRHPITQTIYNMLVDDKSQHVILTGHAGDGKTTIAAELYKKLKGIDFESTLKESLSLQEDIIHNNKEISIIKDFSERSSEDKQNLIDELIQRKLWRCLLVTNTGALLDAFREYEQKKGGDWIDLESTILKKIDSSKPEKMEFQGRCFTIINLSMTENLTIAEEIFQKMIANQHWKACYDKKCQQNCPIFCNIVLMQQNSSIISERLFLAYRRIYEYGTRFTLRQLSAHIAYMITSGQTCLNVLDMTKKAKKPRMNTFMFYNRFFGDDGSNVDGPALQLFAIRKVREQEFGSFPSPYWERKLWIHKNALLNCNSNDSIEKTFISLHKMGCSIEQYKAINARQQVRRMFFFMNDFNKKEEVHYITDFLNSSMISNYCLWQKGVMNENSKFEIKQLEQKIFHVLQEFFSNIRLPERTFKERDLFITLSRSSNFLRQSAQIVIKQCRLEDFTLAFDKKSNGIGGIKKELVLKGKNLLKGVNLILGLPFLDYVIMRNKGEIAQQLHTFYKNRLEEFKGKLIQAAQEEDQNEIMLIRLQTNHKYKRQKITINEKRLEVNDA